MLGIQVALGDIKFVSEFHGFYPINFPLGFSNSLQFVSLSPVYAPEVSSPP